MAAPLLDPAEGQNGRSLPSTTILPVHSLNKPIPKNMSLRRWWESCQGSPESKYLLQAAEALRSTDTPVAFPTETVYGLGAVATRSSAVQGIYKAKQRPSDNPLIVHVCSRQQLQDILRPPGSRERVNVNSTTHSTNTETNLIPPIYEPLISRFWPGPLTIILPNPQQSPLAPEVTSTLSTFGVRMPSSDLARLLIYLVDEPLAAPSANASTKPSPTTAQHVYTDLNGRINIILDGGPCGVGVESTVVDGLSDPPAILRPGGIGMEEIRSCRGWENARIAYKDGAQRGKEAPRAPGMKYRHYSPKAKVVLFEAGREQASVAKKVQLDLGSAHKRIGVVRTRLWKMGLGLSERNGAGADSLTATARPGQGISNGSYDSLVTTAPNAETNIAHLQIPGRDNTLTEMYDISLGTDAGSIARGLFSALRALDENEVDIIYVEGISDTEGDLSAAIMNRLRKAAEVEVKTSES
ncbi:hypothetical protein FQN54_001031 [Arachnomyces sp. PD_36]|nr:hypothetical protein FQN54_001031 [Arachnomyces sp. PD_36]